MVRCSNVTTASLARGIFFCTLFRLAASQSRRVAESLALFVYVRCALSRCARLTKCSRCVLVCCRCRFCWRLCCCCYYCSCRCHHLQGPGQPKLIECEEAACRGDQRMRLCRRGPCTTAHLPARRRRRTSLGSTASWPTSAAWRARSFGAGQRITSKDAVEPAITTGHSSKCLFALPKPALS